MSDLGFCDVGLFDVQQPAWFAGDDQFWKSTQNGLAEISVETQSDSDVDGFGKKRKQPACSIPVGRDQRQRGKNWEKTEEDILVESRGRNLDWMAISECLKSQGFIRDHRHCSDKWYALRKHYIEIHQWMEQNPHVNYWELADSERIRTVPSSFCPRWYSIFDAACQKPDSVKKRVFTDRRRRPPDPSSSHQGLDSTTRSDHDFLPSMEYSTQNLPFSEVGVLWTEIRELSHTLKQKFAAEEEERMRNMEIKERKLQLKIERFHYKRQRDEEMRRRPPGLMLQQLN